MMAQLYLRKLVRMTIGLIVRVMAMIRIRMLVW